MASMKPIRSHAFAAVQKTRQADRHTAFKATVQDQGLQDHLQDFLPHLQDLLLHLQSPEPPKILPDSPTGPAEQNKSVYGPLRRVLHEPYTRK